MAEKQTFIIETTRPQWDSVKLAVDLPIVRVVEGAVVLFSGSETVVAVFPLDGVKRIVAERFVVEG